MTAGEFMDFNLFALRCAGQDLPRGAVVPGEPARSGAWTILSNHDTMQFRMPT
jgi:hypothetical protein